MIGLELNEATDVRDRSQKEHGNGAMFLVGWSLGGGNNLGMGWGG